MPRPPKSESTVLGEAGRLRLGALLRAAREKSGLNLSDASAEFFPGHISTDLLSAIESGRKLPSIAFLITASQIYGLSAFELCVEAGYVRKLFEMFTELKRLGDETCSRYGLKLDRFGLVYDKESNAEPVALEGEQFKRDFRVAELPLAAGECTVPRFTSAVIFLATYIFRCRGEVLKPESVDWFKARWHEELVPFVEDTLRFHSSTSARTPLPAELEWAAQILTAADLDPNARGFPACELVRHWLCSISDRYTFYARLALFRDIPERRAGRGAPDENLSV